MAASWLNRGKSVLSRISLFPLFSPASSPFTRSTTVSSRLSSTFTGSTTTNDYLYGPRPSLPSLTPDLEWDIPQTISISVSEDIAFYRKYLRARLKQGYLNMKEPVTPYDKSQVFFLTIPEIVSAAVRYPKCFRSYFFDEVLYSRIIVEDDDSSIYPFWFDSSITPLSLLRSPIEILSPILPPPGVELICCDASPTQNPHRFGTGGIIKVECTGKLDCLGALIKPGSSFVSEGRASNAGLRGLAEEKVKKVMVLSDNADFVQGMSGNREIRPEYVPLYRCFFRSTNLFEHCVFVHAPRELLAASDAIAHDIMSGGPKLFKFDKVGKVVQLRLDQLSPGTINLIVKQWKGIPVLRLERLRFSVAADGITMQDNKRWSPYYDDPYYQHRTVEVEDED